MKALRWLFLLVFVFSITLAVIMLLVVWGLAPVALVLAPTLFGLFAPPATRMDFVRQVGLLWLLVGIGGGLFRMIELFATRGVGTGLIWAIKDARWAAAEQESDVDAEQAAQPT